jgi:hypothetical protein
MVFYIYSYLGQLYMLNIFEGVSQRGSPGPLRDLPITRIQPQSFGNGEGLVTSFKHFSWNITENTNLCGCYEYFQYYSKHQATQQL